jgi:hypothetical protein
MGRPAVQKTAMKTIQYREQIQYCSDTPACHGYITIETAKLFWLTGMGRFFDGYSTLLDEYPFDN